MLGVRASRSATGVYFLLEGVSSFFFAMLSTAGALYGIQVAHLNALELVLVGTALEVAALAFEVPTGVVADTVSRRLSVIIGLALAGVGFLLWGAIPAFATILVAQVIWAVGYTFLSGATEAWIADEVGSEGIGRVYMRASQVGYGAAALGIVASVGIGSLFGLAAPLLVAGAGHIGLAALLVVIMPEAHWTPPPRGERTRRAHFGDTFRASWAVLRRSPVLRTILAISLIAGAASETFDRLWEFHLLDHFTFPSVPELPLIAWFGMITVTGLLIGVGTLEVLRRRVDTDTHLGAARALLAIDVVLAISLIGFGLAGGLAVAVAFYLTARVMRRIANPIRLAWINQGITSEVRATVISMDGQADAIGQIAGGPLLGWLAATAGSRVAMVAVGLMLVPAVFLYLRTIRLHGRDLEEVAAVNAP